MWPKRKCSTIQAALLFSGVTVSPSDAKTVNSPISCQRRVVGVVSRGGLQPCARPRRHVCRGTAVFQRVRVTLQGNQNILYKSESNELQCFQSILEHLTNTQLYKKSLLLWNLKNVSHFTRFSSSLHVNILTTCSP